jgi:hypothetical protein
VRELTAHAYDVVGLTGIDENSLLYKKRALELLELMKAHGKAWSLYVFSSTRG